MAEIGAGTTAFLLLTLTGSIMVFFALVAAYRYKVQGALAYAGLCLSVAVYAIFYGFEIISPSIEAGMVWSKIQYIGIATIPAWALIFSLQHAGYHPGKSLMLMVWPWIVPLMVIAARFTDEYHHLVYQHVTADFHNGIMILDIQGGLIYHLNVIYINLMLLISAIIVIRIAIRTKQVLLRRRIYIILAGFFAPWVSHIIYQAGLSPMGTDLTPYGFAVTGLFLGYAVFVYRLFEAAPLVRDEVFRSLQDGIIVTDTNNIIIEANPSAMKYFGRFTMPLIGADAGSLFRTSTPMGAILEEAGTSTDRIAVINTRIGDRSFLIRQSVLRDQSLERIGNILIFSDVTETIAIEETLKAKTIELESYFSNSVDMLCILDQRGNILHVNPAWTQVMGYRSDDIVGKNTLSLVHEDDRDRVIEKMRNMQETGGVISCQARFRTSDSLYKWLDWRVNATGETLYASIRDITRRVAEQDSLRKLLYFSEEFLQHPVGKTNYTMICEHFAALSHSRLVMLFIRPDNSPLDNVQDLVCTVHAEQKQSMLVFDYKDPEGSEEPINTDSSTMLDVVSEDDPVMSLVRLRMPREDLTSKVYRLALHLGTRIAGEFVFVADESPIHSDTNILGLFARQTGMLLARMDAEEVGFSEKAYFENLFESSPAGIVILNSKDQVLRTNLEFCRMFGYEEQEVIGHQINDLIVPEHLKGEGSKVTEAVSRGEVIRHKTKRQRKNGELMSVSILGKPVQLLTGETLVYGIYIDITEQIHTEQTLKKRQQQLQHALDLQRQISETALELNARRSFEERIERVLRNIGTAANVSRVYIFENDPENLYTSNTFEWCASGITPQITELQEIPYAEIESFRHHLEDEGALISSDTNTLDEATRSILEPQGVKAIVVYTLWVEHRFFGFIGYDECRGERVWTDAELELLRAVSAIISNAYERRAIEKDLLEERDKATLANLAKSEFLANMSHEIRTPMNAILGFSESLYEQLKEPEHKSMLNSVLSGGRSLLSLLNDILDLSKIEAGRMEIMTHSIQLRGMIGEITTLFKDKASRKGIGMYVNIPENIPLEISLDEIRLKQVLFNLIGNAVKFTHQGYVQVGIEFEITGDGKGKLTFQIQDTGIGIPVDQLTGIFDSFIQVSGRANRSYEGTGLGLTISKRLVERMNGEILVESNEGIGSVFSLVFHDVRFTNLPSTDGVKHAEPDSPTFTKSRVVIIDDVESNILLMEGILTTLGLEIYTARSGQEGIRLVQQVKPDVVVLDIRMPMMDGFQVAKMLREDESTNHIPLLAYTAALIELRSSPDSHYFDGIVVKPIIKKDLLAELSRFLPSTGNMFDSTAIQPHLTEGEAIELPDEEVRHTIYQNLTDEFMPLWESVNDQLVLFKIESFASSIKVMAINHNFAYLENYAERLLQEVNNLNLDQIQDILKYFPEIVRQLAPTPNDTTP